MTRAWAVVWAQWRTYRNYGNRAGRIAGLIVSVLWYGLWAAAGVAAAMVMAQPDAGTLTVPISAALLLMSLYWQFIPMMMAASGLALDLRKLQAYPIPTRELFAIEALLRITAAGEMLLVLVGAAVGVALNPKLPLWCALAAVPFAGFHIFLGLGIRDIFTRLFSHRRVREIVALGFVALITLPRLIFGRRGGGGRWLAEQFRNTDPTPGIPWFPWTAAGHLLTGKDVAIASLVLAGWAGLAGVFALWQFRRTLRFDADAARSAGSAPAAARSTWRERLYRLPAGWLPDPLGMLVEKDLRYLARAPRFRMLFLMGAALGVVIPRAIFRDAAPGWAPAGITVATAYALLLLGEVCVWNTFGFDRSAAQIYFLAPLRFTRVIVAKNLVAAVFVMAQIGAIALLNTALRAPVTWLQIAEAGSFAAVVLPLLWSAGNYMSVRSPRPANPESAMRSRAAGGTQLLLVLLYPVTFLPVALAYFARWAFSSEWAFFGVMAAMLGLALMVYVVSLETAAEYAGEHKEEFVTALSAGQGPIAS